MLLPELLPHRLGIFFFRVDGSQHTVALVLPYIPGGSPTLKLLGQLTGSFFRFERAQLQGVPHGTIQRDLLCFPCFVKGGVQRDGAGRGNRLNHRVVSTAGGYAGKQNHRR